MLVAVGLVGEPELIVGLVQRRVALRRRDRPSVLRQTHGEFIHRLHQPAVHRGVERVPRDVVPARHGRDAATVLSLSRRRERRPHGSKRHQSDAHHAAGWRSWRSAGGDSCPRSLTSPRSTTVAQPCSLPGRQSRHSGRCITARVHGAGPAITRLTRFLREFPLRCQRIGQMPELCQE